MKKTLFIAIALVALAASFGFAKGAQENDVTENAGPGPGAFSGELVTVTGDLIFNDNDFPTIKSGDKEYELMYPYMLNYEIEVAEGTEITVEGFLVPGPRWNDGEDEEHLMVTKAVIDGKEYIIPHGPMAAGRFGGYCWDDEGSGRRGYRSMMGRSRGYGPGRGRR